MFYGNSSAFIPVAAFYATCINRQVVFTGNSVYNKDTYRGWKPENILRRRNDKWGQKSKA